RWSVLDIVITPLTIARWRLSGMSQITIVLLAASRARSRPSGLRQHRLRIDGSLGIRATGRLVILFRITQFSGSGVATKWPSPTIELSGLLARRSASIW